MRKIIVDKKYDGKKLNTYILEQFPNLSSGQFYKALRKKDIRVNGIKVSENRIVHQGDEIEIYIVDGILLGETINQIKIVYEDDYIFVVNKPEGISITAERSSDITLTSLLKEKYGQNIEPCHRLDRNTKGLVLYAKTKEALQILLKKFKNKEIEKHYIAKVYGIPPKQHDRLEAYLFKDRKKSRVYIVDIPKKDYVKIITEYTLLEKNVENHTAILDIQLHTGKTHQIRAHLAHIGLPIIGDGKYGNYEINKKMGKKTQELYAYKIKFCFTTESGILTYLDKKEIKCT